MNQEIPQWQIERRRLLDAGWDEDTHGAFPAWARDPNEKMHWIEKSIMVFYIMLLLSPLLYAILT
jgi:hypothetical protein